MLYKLFTKSKTFYFEMQGKYMISKFHTINNFKSLYSDIHFKINTKLKPTLFNTSNAKIYQVFTKIPEDKPNKIFEFHDSYKLARSINTCPKEDLKKIIDDIPIEHLQQVQMFSFIMMKINSEFNNNFYENSDIELSGEVA